MGVCVHIYVRPGFLGILHNNCSLWTKRCSSLLITSRYMPLAYPIASVIPSGCLCNCDLFVAVYSVCVHAEANGSAQLIVVC